MGPTCTHILPATQVTVVRPAEYAEGQPIPAHALPRFKANPLDNFNVMAPVAEWLRGYWTAAHQSLGWRREVSNEKCDESFTRRPASGA